MNNIQVSIAAFENDGDGNPVASFELLENESIAQHRKKIADYLAALDKAIATYGLRNLNIWGDG